MRFATLSVVVLALSSGASLSQSLASIGGPKEVPPASYQGQQYVDSRGCVFLKAGYGGQTNWVPRVNAQRKALCGYPPTFAAVKIEMADETVAPAKAAAPVAGVVVAGPKSDKPASASPDPAGAASASTAGAGVNRPPAKAQAHAAPRGAVVRVGAAQPRAKIGCYTSVPVAEVVRLRNGGMAVVCTRGDGGVSGWRPPVYPAGAPVGVALHDPVARRAVDPGRVGSPRPARQAADAPAGAIPTPPKGYKLAWTDDRLNPQRAQGTAAGRAAQDQIWTEDVPARLVAPAPHRSGKVSVSSKSTAPSVAPPAAVSGAASRGALVQVGSFGVASNADGAMARLKALGLPVAKGRTTRGGKTLQIVFAGPFNTGAQAQAALAAARRSGFSDAFLR